MRIAIGLALTDMGTRGGVSDSADASGGLQDVINAEDDGLFIDFTTQSATVKDASVLDGMDNEAAYLAIDFVYRLGPFAQIKEP